MIYNFKAKNGIVFTNISSEYIIEEKKTTIKKFFAKYGVDELELKEHVGNDLIDRAAKLTASKASKIDAIVLGVKNSRAGIYKQKYEDAKEGLYDSDEKEKALIIKRHNAQMKASFKVKNKIERAYKKFKKLVESGKHEKAEIALQLLDQLDISATDEDIDKLLS